MRCFVWISKVVGHFSVPGKQVIRKDKELKAVGIKPRNKFFIDRVFKVQVLDSGVCGKLPYTTFRGKSRGIGA